MSWTKFARYLQCPKHIQTSRNASENALLLRQLACELARFCLINTASFIIRVFLEQWRQKAETNALNMMSTSSPCRDHRRTCRFKGNNTYGTLCFAQDVRDTHQHR